MTKSRRFTRTAWRWASRSRGSKPASSTIRKTGIKSMLRIAFSSPTGATIRMISNRRDGGFWTSEAENTTTTSAASLTERKRGMTLMTHCRMKMGSASSSRSRADRRAV